MTVGIIGLIVWVIGIPLLAFCALYEEKNSLEVKLNKIRFGFLFKGYKKKAYYWEIVVMLRKVILAFISVFMESYGTTLQAMLVIVLVVGFVIMTNVIRPF